MRNLLFSLLFLASSQTFSQSSNYQPMLEDGKTWDVFWGDAGGIVPYTDGVRFLTDGVQPYGGQQYHSLWYRSFVATSSPVFVAPFMLTNPIPFGLIREDTVTRKVYFRKYQFDWSAGEERLIYDFSLPPGDSIQMANGVWYVLDSISVTTIQNGELRRQFHFHATDQAFGQTFYIEGIGGKNHFTQPLIEYFESLDDLVCVKKYEEVLYAAGAYPSPCAYIVGVHSPLSEKISIAPNPVDQELRVETGSGQFDLLKLLDIEGKVLGEWQIPANGDMFIIPVQHIPEGPFWGILIGKRNIAHFKALKVR